MSTGWLTPEQVAEELHLSVDTVRLQCRAQQWPGAKKFGGQWRIPRAALEPPVTTPLIAPRGRRSTAQQRKRTA